MPELDYLNQSSYQDYPFVVDASAFGRQYILDCDLSVGPLPWTTQAMYLVEVEDLGTSRKFHIRDAASGRWFGFIVPDGSPFGYVVWAEASLTKDGTTSPALGIGFMQFGDVSNLANWTGQLEISPALISNFSNHAVSSIVVANKYTTLYGDSECDIEPTIPGGSEYKINPAITGDVILSAGQFSTVTSLPANNAISIGTATSAVESGDRGAELCDDKRVVPDGYDKNSEPTCGDTLLSINGVTVNSSSHYFNLVGGNGVEITKTGSSELTILFNQLLLFGAIYDIPNCDT